MSPDFSSATSDCSALRARLRTWLREHAPSSEKEPASLDERFAFRHQWHRLLYEGGWLGLHWPKEYGGLGLSSAEQVVFHEECGNAEAPPIANWVGVELVGPTLLRWGTELQKAHYLPRILRGEDIWCQGWSEPDAGSDLSAVKTTAHEEGSDFVIEGHKRWTSWAQFATHCMVLARTGAADDRHKSLSCFIVPLRSPGVTVTPIRMANEEAEENDVLLRGVRVAADNLVGRLNGGWSVVLTAMGFARGTCTLPRVTELEQRIRRLMRAAREPPRRPAILDPRLRERLVRAMVRVEALRDLAIRKLRETASDEDVGPVGSTEKLLWSRIAQEVGELGLQLHGVCGLLPVALAGESWPGERKQFYFRAKATAIEGGTSEIQRNIIARRVLRVMD